jgi:Reverse transcriptase (RNA-dependent DNA polymerase)
MFALIVKTFLIWVVLLFAAHHGWPAHQMDVKSTYLNRKLEDSEDLYLRQPPGYTILGNEHLVLQLKKAIYSLKQSGHCWYKTFSDILKQIGLNPCKSNSAVFIWQSKDQGITILMAYINDLTLVASSMDLVNVLKRDLKLKLEMTDMGELHWLLGIKIKWDPEKHTISLSQQSYIQSIIDCYSLSDARTVLMPLDPHNLLSKNQCPIMPCEFGEMWNVPYCEAVGSLMYTALRMRPDIAYTVGHLA